MTRAENAVEVALFPIPNIVAFPGHKVPLHIFEPRYRVLVKDSVRLHRRVGVCHIKKVIRFAKESKCIEEKLQKNQDTYEPQDIFSAGFCEIQDITDDGRLYADVLMESRYRILETLQEVPYKVVLCESYKDHSSSPSEADALEARREIDAILKDFSKTQDSALSEMLGAKSWSQQSLSEYSFSIFQILKFEVEIMQSLLEMQSPMDRLEVVRQSLLTMKG